jgi:hypothetical protein
MRKVIISVATCFALLLPATAFASGHKPAKQQHHARSGKRVAKAKSSKRSKHADNDRTLLTPKWT